MSQVQAFHLNILTCHLSSKSNITIRNITHLGLVVTDCTWQQIPIYWYPSRNCVRISHYWCNSLHWFFGCHKCRLFTWNLFPKGYNICCIQPIHNVICSGQDCRLTLFHPIVVLSQKSAPNNLLWIIITKLYEHLFFSLLCSELYKIDVCF